MVKNPHGSAYRRFCHSCSGIFVYPPPRRRKRFEGLQRVYAAVHQRTSERQLSRIAYLAEKCLPTDSVGVFIRGIMIQNFAGDYSARLNTSAPSIG
jgi:hypothetical protein